MRRSIPIERSFARSALIGALVSAACLDGPRVPLYFVDITSREWFSRSRMVGDIFALLFYVGMCLLCARIVRCRPDSEGPGAPPIRRSSCRNSESPLGGRHPGMPCANQKKKKMQYRMLVFFFTVVCDFQSQTLLVLFLAGAEGEVPQRPARVHLGYDNER